MGAIMAYAYRFTERDTGMSGDREKALLLALKAVLNVAGKQGLNIDELSEAAINELLHYRAYHSEHVPLAICEIEKVADALHQ